jgi:hypothetical protein
MAFKQSAIRASSFLAGSATTVGIRLIECRLWVNDHALPAPDYLSHIARKFRDYGRAKRYHNQLSLSGARISVSTRCETTKRDTSAFTYGDVMTKLKMMVCVTPLRR